MNLTEGREKKFNRLPQLLETKAEDILFITRIPEGNFLNFQFFPEK